MDILIIEDELPARSKLVSMLKEIDPLIRIVGQPGSVKDTLTWLNKHSAPDLAFVDIRLSDDHSFEIFRRRKIDFPVIFTTAYDQYLLESFEFNSIDYLLKPITEENLKRSLGKVKSLQRHFQENLLNLIAQSSQVIKRDRIVAKKGTEFITLTPDDVAYIYADHKIVFLKDFSGRQLLVDKTLGEWEDFLVGHQFFRLNRQYIANLKSIDRFKPDEGRIRVFLKPETREEIYISKETAPEFRKWVGQTNV